MRVRWLPTLVLVPLALAAQTPAPSSSHPSAAAALPKDQGDRDVGPAHMTRSPVLARNGIAATSQPLATQVAVDVLKRGGTAVDAAIAASAVMGVLEPGMTGMGGDLFALVWDPRTRKLHGINASGRAPRGLDLQRQIELADARGRMSRVGWPAVTIPGAVDGWFELHKRFGKLPVRELFAPAIAYAEQGVPITQDTAALWLEDAVAFGLQARTNPYLEFENWSRVMLPDGMPPAHGTVFRNPDLARSYRVLAAEGRDAFYKGRLARAMEGYFRRIGAPHRLSDLEAHRSEWVEPVSVEYRGYRVYEMPPPGQGMAALQMLKLLEGYDLRALGRRNPEFWHLLIEAKKLAFADRAALFGDDPRVPVARLLSDEYAALRRKLIDPRRAAPRVDAGLRSTPDTNYMAVADRDGMMVSLIQSNAGSGGSGLIPDDGEGRTLGFVLQNRGMAFRLEPGHPNTYAPGKRPHHTIIPAFVTRDGQPWLAFGALGGDMQPQAHVQILVNIVDFGMDVQSAGDAARLMHTGSADPDGRRPLPDGGLVKLESGIPEGIAEALRARGHRVERDPDAFFGGYQAVMRDPRTGVYWGASEFRTDGQASGY